MLRPLAIAAVFVLAAPTFSPAQEHRDEHHPPAGRPAPVPRPTIVPHTPALVPHPPGPGPMAHGPVRGPYVFHGRPFAWHPVRFPRPWAYPPGYAYRLWAVGAILPPLFWSTPTYYYADWADMGLPPPDPGFQYVEYGPDLLLVNVTTGEVVEVFPGAFS